MRSLRGDVLLPPNAPAGRAGLVLIQVQDASYEDAPAETVAEQRLQNVVLRPGGRIAFRLDVPEVAPGHTLLVRAHVDMGGRGRVSSGDLLTTAAHSVPPTGPISHAEVPVVLI